MCREALGWRERLTLIGSWAGAIAAWQAAEFLRGNFSGDDEPFYVIALGGLSIFLAHVTRRSLAAARRRDLEEMCGCARRSKTVEPRGFEVLPSRARP